MLTERVPEVQKDEFAFFIDYDKAINKIRHEKLFEMLKDLEVDEKDLRLTKEPIFASKTEVHVGEGVSMCQDIQRGVRQGCIQSPDLFNF